MQLLLVTLLSATFAVSTLSGILPQSDAFARSEEEQIELLTNSAQATLERLATLKAALKAFRAQEAICVANPTNRDQLYTLSQRAYELRAALNQSHLSEYFRPAFLEEISKLSGAAAHPTLPSVGQDQIQ